VTCIYREIHHRALNLRYGFVAGFTVAHVHVAATSFTDAAESMHNTPPTYGIYIAGLVFQWLKRKGGLAAIEQLNIAKANALYSYLDATDFYNNPIDIADRSRMNIPFTFGSLSFSFIFFVSFRNSFPAFLRSCFFLLVFFFSVLICWHSHLLIVIRCQLGRYLIVIKESTNNFTWPAYEAPHKLCI